MIRVLSLMAVTSLVLSTATTLPAASLFGPGDLIIAVDVDPDSLFSESDYPANESPANLLDGDVATKYLNFGKENAGIIVTPGIGPSTLRTIDFYSANDFVERDPASYAIYGTNDTILSLDGSDGLMENWTLISEGDLLFSEDRQVLADSVSFENSISYASYRLTFPSLRDTETASSLQLSDVSFFDGPNGTGNALLSAGDTVLGIDTSFLGPRSDYPAGESPLNALDGDIGTKYLNFGKPYSGFIVTPASGPSTLNQIDFYTANDFVGRDPTFYTVYGTNDAITTVDNGRSNDEQWTLISQGYLTLPEERDTFGDTVTFANSTEYRSYRVLFPTQKDAGECCLQVAEVELWSAEGTITSDADAAIATYLKDTQSDSSFPNGENPQLALDGDANTKYLNFGGSNSGFIVVPAAEPATVRSFQITTADDFVERDPASWILYGTHAPIDSTQNHTSDADEWVEIASGTLDLPTARQTAGPLVNVPNTSAFTAYRMVFPTLRGAGNAMQISEIQFFDTAALRCDLNGDGTVDAGDAGIMFGVWGSLNDATNSADKNGDGFVDASDAGVMFGEWTGDPGAVVSGTVAAEYDPSTGELTISSRGVINLFVESHSGVLTPLSPSPTPPVGLLSNSTKRVGITNLGPIDLENYRFGSIGAGLSLDDLTLVYTAGFGQAAVIVPASTDGAFQFVPEPTVPCYLLLAAGATFWRPRRRSAGR